MRYNELVDIIIWMVGLIISIFVGSEMILNNISISIIPLIIEKIMGWFIIIGSITGAIITIFNK